MGLCDHSASEFLSLEHLHAIDSYAHQKDLSRRYSLSSPHHEHSKSKSPAKSPSLSSPTNGMQFPLPFSNEAFSATRAANDEMTRAASCRSYDEAGYQAGRIAPVPLAACRYRKSKVFLNLRPLVLPSDDLLCKKKDVRHRYRDRPLVFNNFEFL